MKVTRNDKEEKFVFEYTVQEALEEIILFFLCRAGMYPFQDRRIREEGDSPIYWYMRYLIYVGNIAFKEIIPTEPEVIKQCVNEEINIMQEKKLIKKTEAGLKPAHDYDKFMFTAQQNDILHKVLNDMLDTDFLRRF